MIRMIKGTYGRMAGGVVEAMTPRSAPFSLSEVREAELIAAGVAEKVETPARGNTYGNMKITELRKTAAAFGIDAGAARNKNELIAMIEEAQPKDGGIADEF